MSNHINSDYRAKALLEAFKQEYPFAARGLTLEMLHNILDNHCISVRAFFKFGKLQSNLTNNERSEVIRRKRETKITNLKVIK